MQQMLTVLQTLGQLSMHPLTGALFLLLGIAAASDYHSYRIPNWLTLSGVLYGLVCHALLQASPYQGLLWSLQGLLLCLALTLPLYVFSMMGAGDVKLITMVGAFVGAQSAITVVLCMFVAGGVVALVCVISRRVLGQLLQRVAGLLHGLLASTLLRMLPPLPFEASGSVGRVPFALAIGIGTVGFVVARQLGKL